MIARARSARSGVPGGSGYTQDHRQFGLDGKLIGEAAGDLPKSTAKASRGKPAPAPKPTHAPAAIADKPSLAALPDNELRTMVEIAGGTWTSRAAALAFLAEGG